jgi:hypothetical protein
MKQYPPYALSFNGVNSYVEVPHNNILNSGLGDELTLEAWIYIPEFLADHHIFLTKGLTLSALTANYFIRYDYTAPNVYLEFSYTKSDQTAYISWLSVANPITTKKWFHVAVTFRFGYPETFKFYVNGTAISGGWVSGSGTEAPYVSTQPLWLCKIYSGAGIPAGEPFNGLIVEARKYNRALSQSEIQRNMWNPLNPVRDGLVLWFPMLEGSGTTVKDYSGNNNNGILYNGVAWKELSKYEIPAGAGL